MRLRLSWPLAASLLVLPLGGRASAQVQAFSDGFEVWVDGERLTNAPVVYVGPAQCAQGAQFALTVRGLSAPDGISTLEFWAAPSPGADCRQAANRAEVMTSITPCWLVGKVANVSTTARLSVDAQDIFRPDPQDDSGTCPGHDGDAVTIFAVPLASPSANSPSSPPEPLPGIPMPKATLTLGSGPSAPTGLKGRDGDRALEVRWSKAPDARAKSTYTVYWDTGVGTDASCSSSLLREGELAPEQAVDDGFLFATTTVGTDSSLDDLDSRDVRFGDYVAVGVVHRSSTGSVSPLSEVLCLQRVKTWAGDPVPLPEPEDSNRCSVRAGAAERAGGDLGALALAGAWLVVRRAQRARLRRNR